MNRLQRILDSKRTELEAAKVERSVAELRAAVADLPPTRGFARRLHETLHPVGLIAEVKRASPSQGLIRPNFNAVALAQAYVRAGAECLSVLTDAPFFQGSPEDLQAVRAAVEVPLLRKDFTIDSYQLLEARVWGADCILLIVAALEPALMSDLAEAAQELGMDVLVEVHDEAELEVALAMSAGMIGVNNRDLTTFETDLAVSEQLLPHLVDRALGISESALNSLEEVQRVERAGARAVLIGTRFAGSNNPEAAVHEVMGR